MSSTILSNARDLIVSIVEEHGYECSTSIVMDDNPAKNSVCYFTIADIRRSGFIVWDNKVKELKYVYVDINQYIHMEKEGFDEKYLEEQAKIYKTVNSLNEFIEVLINKTTNTKNARLQ